MHNTQRVHQHAIASLALAAVAAAALLDAPRPAGADAERRPADPLGRTVSEVYIKPGWLLQRVPELFAQLELTGSINYGHWPTAPKGRQRPEPPPPPGTRTDAFEFKAGTVREALDAFVAANPILTWEADGEGRVAIRREPQSKRVEDALATTVGEVGVEQLAIAGWGAFSAISDAWDHVVERETDDNEANWLRRNAHAEQPKWSDFFDGRMPTPITPWREQPNQTFGDVLENLTPAGSHSFWYAIEADDQRPLGGSVAKSLTFGIMTGAPMRRKLDTPVLIQCLRQDYAPLHGYLDKRVRVKDAQCELERRFHYDPEAVTALLTAETTLKQLIPDDGVHPSSRVRWMSHLGSIKISNAVFRRASSLESRRRGLQLLGAFPPLDFDEASASLLPHWRDVAATTQDPLVRDYANFILDLHKWLEDGGEASGRRRPLLPGI